MRSSLVLSLSLLAAGTLLAPLPAQATVVLQPSLSDMTVRSNLVLHATVEDQSITLDATNRVITLTRLKVLESVKGAQAGDTVTIYQVGGTKDGQVASIVGTNSFKVGEEVVVFGSRFLAQNVVSFLQANRKAEVNAGTLNPTGGWMVVYAIGLGKFRVERPLDGVAMVTEELGDVAVARREGNTTQVTPIAYRTRQPLNVFLEEVRRVAGQPGRTP